MRIIRRILSIVLLIGLLTITVSAATEQYPFSWSAATTAIGTMKWSKKDFQSNGQTAHTYIPTSTISTFCFLTPQKGSTVQATNIRQLVTAGTYYYTWNPSYGGALTSYFMAAYPDPAMFPWPAYSFTATYGN